MKRKKNKENIISNEQILNNKGNKTKKFGEHFHISILTILLIVFLLQLIYGVIINSAKIYSLNAKILKLEKINKVAHKKNQYLREELEKYTSSTGVEALARNRLQFSKPDETLVIIKDNNENTENETY